jgi:hypothetical protein
MSTEVNSNLSNNNLANLEAPNKELFLAVLGCMPEIEFIYIEDDLQIASSLTGQSLSRVESQVNLQRRRLQDAGNRSTLSIAPRTVSEDQAHEEVFLRSALVATQEANMEAMRYGIIPVEKGQAYIRMLLAITNQQVLNYRDFKPNGRTTFIQGFNQILRQERLTQDSMNLYLGRMSKLVIQKMTNVPLTVATTERRVAKSMLISDRQIDPDMRGYVNRIDSFAQVDRVNTTPQLKIFLRQFDFASSGHLETEEDLITNAEIAESNFVTDHLSSDMKNYYSVSSYFEKLAADVAASSHKPATTEKIDHLAKIIGQGRNFDKILIQLYNQTAKVNPYGYPGLDYHKANIPIAFATIRQLLSPLSYESASTRKLGDKVEAILQLAKLCS